MFYSFSEKTQRLKMKINSCLKWSIIFALTFTMIYYSIAQFSKASLYGILNVFTIDLSEDIHENPTDYLILPHFSAKESQLMQTKLKIFFVQTSENPDLLSRHACSIESAARLHPTGSIYVLMQSKYIHLNKGSFIHLRDYANLHFVHFNEHEIYRGTSLMRLNQTKRKEFIQYFTISHRSDLIRTAILYKYGGIYFDLDVIPLRNFDRFINTVGLESDDAVNVAVLAFEKQHLVLDLQMEIQLVSIGKSLCWNCVGPLALTEALKKVCDQGKLSVHKMDKCHQIDIQPSFVFYPIAYQEIPQFFRYSSENVHSLLQNSSIYSVHYFHHMTMNIPIEMNSPFAQIAGLFCPNASKQLLSSHRPLKFLFTDTYIFFICLVLTIFCIITGKLIAQLSMRMMLSTRRRTKLNAP